MNPAPAFQIYPTDELQRMTAAGLSAQERGVYLTMKLMLWKATRLPDDVNRLAIVGGVQVGPFRKMWPHIQKLFAHDADGWFDEGLEQQRRQHEDFRRLQQEKGIKSGEARRRRRTDYPTDSEPDSATVPADTGTEVGTGVQPDASPEVTSLISDLQTDVHSHVGSRAIAPQDGPRFGHRTHTYCGRYVGEGEHRKWKDARFCVPRMLHDDFANALGDKVATFDLLAWYEQEDAKDDGLAPCPDLFAFWRPRFKQALVDQGLYSGNGNGAVYGPPMTREERAQLQEWRRKVGGGCPHQGACQSPGECSKRIVNGWRERDGVKPLPP